MDGLHCMLSGTCWLGERGPWRVVQAEAVAELRREHREVTFCTSCN